MADKLFNNFTWHNRNTALDTPLSAENLQKLNDGIDAVDTRVAGLDYMPSNPTSIVMGGTTFSPSGINVGNTSAYITATIGSVIVKSQSDSVNIEGEYVDVTGNLRVNGDSVMDAIDDKQDKLEYITENTSDDKVFISPDNRLELKSNVIVLKTLSGENTPTIDIDATEIDIDADMDIDATPNGSLNIGTNAVQNVNIGDINNTSLDIEGDTIDIDANEFDVEADSITLTGVNSINGNSNDVTIETMGDLTINSRVLDVTTGGYMNITAGDDDITLATDDGSIKLNTTDGSVLINDRDVLGEIDSVNNALPELQVLGWNVPKECPIQNEISGSTLIQKVGRVDLSTLSWEMAYEGYGRYSFSLKNKAKGALNNDTAPNAYLVGYTMIPANSISSQTMGSNKFTIAQDGTAAITTDSPSGILYYELLTPINHSIPDESAVDSVKSSLNNNRLFVGTIIYDGEKLPFDIGYRPQFCIIGRNTSTGAIITAWYDYSIGGFRVVSGNINQGQQIGASFVY